MYSSLRVSQDTFRRLKEAVQRPRRGQAEPESVAEAEGEREAAEGERGKGSRGAGSVPLKTWGRWSPSKPSRRQTSLFHFLGRKYRVMFSLFWKRGKGEFTAAFAGYGEKSAEQSSVVLSYLYSSPPASHSPLLRLPKVPHNFLISSLLAFIPLYVCIWGGLWCC